MAATYLERDIETRLNSALTTMPVVVLSGMRQTGKTTVLQRAPGLVDRPRVDLDDFATEAAAQSDPLALLSRHPELSVDEVQRVPELMRAVKVLVDRDRRPGRFLLSGSANLLLTSQVAESLAGRAVYLELSPMTHREVGGGAGERPWLVRLLEQRQPDLTMASATLNEAHIFQGGMPPVVIDGADLDTWMLGFEQTYLERDVRGLSAVADLGAFRRLLRLLALRTATSLNLSNLARDAAISVATASRYVDLLEASFSIFRLPPFLGNRVARLVKRPRVFIADAGLATHLSGHTARPPGSVDPLAGALLETWAAVNLRALLQCWRPSATLMYWSVQGRYEVDFVVEDPAGVVAIEVKRTTRWSRSDLRSLRRFLEVTPGCVAGLLACQVREPVSLGGRLYAVPLSLLVS